MTNCATRKDWNAAQKAVIAASRAMDAISWRADQSKRYRDSDIQSRYLAEVRALGFRN